MLLEAGVSRARGPHGLHQSKVPQVQAKLRSPLSGLGCCASSSGSSTLASADYGGNGGGSLTSRDRSIACNGGALGASTGATEPLDMPLWWELEKYTTRRCAKLDRVGAASSGYRATE